MSIPTTHNIITILTNRDMSRRGNEFGDREEKVDMMGYGCASAGSSTKLSLVSFSPLGNVCFVQTSTIFISSS